MLTETMNKDILCYICARLDDKSLEKLSKTRLWDVAKTFIGTEYYWYLRTEILIGRKLLMRTEGSWKNTYYTLSNPNGIVGSMSAMTVSILIEVKGKPTTLHPRFDKMSNIILSLMESFYARTGILNQPADIEPESRD